MIFALGVFEGGGLIAHYLYMILISCVSLGAKKAATFYMRCKIDDPAN